MVLQQFSAQGSLRTVVTFHDFGKSMLHFYTPPIYTLRMPSHILWSKTPRQTPFLTCLGFLNTAQCFVLIFLLQIPQLAACFFQDICCILLVNEHPGQHCMLLKKKIPILQLLWLPPLEFILASFLVCNVAILNPFQLLTIYRNPFLLDYTTHWVLFLDILLH